MEYLVSNIAAFRKAKRMTQEELANRSGLTRPAIGNYEQGKRVPSIDNVIKIYKGLGIKVQVTYECIEDEI